MRPINLIPPEDRRGVARTSSRSGGLAYVALGLLVVVLLGVMLVVLADNKVSDKKDELAGLQTQSTELAAQAAELTPYTTFHSTRDTRVATVAALADSRFDWERVMRELALVLPKDVWLSNLTGTVSPAVQIEGSEGIPLRDSVPGPALELVGCTTSQDSVAGLISALKQIDGVSRVAVQSSRLPTLAASDSGGGAAPAVPAGGDSDCQTRDFIVKFEIVAAFDAAPTPLSSTDSGTTVAAPVTTPAGAAPAATDATTTAPAAVG